MWRASWAVMVWWMVSGMLAEPGVSRHRVLPGRWVEVRATEGGGHRVSVHSAAEGGRTVAAGWVSREAYGRLQREQSAEAAAGGVTTLYADMLGADMALVLTWDGVAIYLTEIRGLASERPSVWTSRLVASGSDLFQPVYCVPGEVFRIVVRRAATAGRPSFWLRRGADGGHWELDDREVFGELLFGPEERGGRVVLAPAASVEAVP